MTTEKTDWLDFLLVGPDCRDLPAERGGWCREGIWLSDVALVVKVRPTHKCLTGEVLEQTKQALYAFLRRVSQTALEHDFMRPVACVIVLPADPAVASGRLGEISRAMRRWGADQEWHRGAFTLYSEFDSEPKFDPERLASDRRVLDLLKPQVTPIEESERAVRTLETLIGSLTNEAETRGPLEQSLVNAVIEDLRAYEAGHESEAGKFSISRWKWDHLKPPSDTQPAPTGQRQPDSGD